MRPRSILFALALAAHAPAALATPVVSAEFGMDAPVGTPANQQVAPDVAFDGTNFLVVWQDFRTSSYADIYGARVSPAGTVLDTAGIAISTAPNTQANPAVVFDGMHYFVVWEDGRGPDLDVYGARVTPGGMVLDPAGVPICTAAGNQDAPSVGWNGTNFLVAWEDTRSGGYDIFATRVSPSGMVLDLPNVHVAAAAALEQLPAVASDGTNFLVAWTDFRTDPAGDAYGGRVSPAGALLDGTGHPIDTGPGEQTSVALTFDGTDYVAAWQDGRAMPGSDDDIYAARIDPTFSVRDAAGIAIATGANLQTAPDVTYVGPNLLIAWQENPVGMPATIHAGRLSPAGSVLDVGGFVIASDPSRELAPALGVGAGEALVGYQRLDPSAMFNTDRTRGRFVTSDVPVGGHCTSAGSCTSGFCVDGVCCSTACGGSNPSDCQACSVAAGAATDGTCGVVSATHVCRPSSAPCDAAETCDGSSTACPPDRLATTGTVCRAPVNPCDAPATCTGSSATCPPTVPAAAGTVCRPAASACDVAETCNGSASSCPPDANRPAGTLCHTAIGPCDSNAYCTGSSASCPPATVAIAGIPCRDSAGPCDVGEMCDGTHAACPADTFVTAGTECRPSTGACDLAEACDGSTAACPPDAVRPAGFVCGTTAGPCAMPGTCNGAAVTCPASTFLPVGTVCRPATDLCDAPEVCSGFSAPCPPDTIRSGGVVCRPSAGACDMPETCNGISRSCPPDAFLPAGHLCHSSAGDCDMSESCSGTSAACPPNSLMPAGTVCRASMGVCDPAESCDGTNPSCPPNGFLPVGTVCDDHDLCSSNDSCNAAGRCVGQLVTCANGRECFATSCCDGMAVSCDDHDPCTVDDCSPSGGCSHTRLSTPGCTPDAGVDAGPDADNDVVDAGGPDAPSDAMGGGGDTAGDVGMDGDGGSDSRHGGCGCRTPARTPGPVGGWWILLAVAIAVRRRAVRRAAFATTVRAAIAPTD